MKRARSRLKRTRTRRKIITLIGVIILLSALFFALSIQTKEPELISPFVRAYEVTEIEVPKVEEIEKLEVTFSHVKSFTTRQREITNLIDDIWGEDYILGRRLAFCESTLGERLSNSQSSASGVFHIIDSTWIEMRHLMNKEANTSLKLNDVENITTAYKLYKIRGTKPWDASKSCWKGN